MAPAQSDEQLREQIQSVLIKSNMYEQINNELRVKLLQDGWIDRVKEMTINELLKPHAQGEKTFTQVLNSVEQPALDDVPEDIKAEIMNKLKTFLNNVVE